MKQKTKDVILSVFLAAVVVAMLIHVATLPGRSVAIETEADTVRVVVHDTIRIVEPQPVQVTALPQVVRWLPRWREPRSEVRGTSDEAQDAIYMACGADSVAVDSVAVVVPMERKVYEDSTYRAVITGAWASLDTIEVYPRREIVTIRNSSCKHKRWGISAGIGAAIGTDRRIRPVLFLGATYTFATF